jgi:hypothetical protein
MISQKGKIGTTDEFELYITEQIEGDVVGGMTYRSGIPLAVYLPVVFRNTP